MERLLEYGGFGGQGGQSPTRHRRRPPYVNRWTVLAFIALALLLSFDWLITTLTEWLWFRAIGYERVWWTTIWARVGLFTATFLATAVVLIGNWRLARFLVIRVPNILGEERLLEERWVAPTITAAGLLLAWVTAQVASGRWMDMLRYIARRPFSTQDPLFGQDVGFYIFELPVYEFVSGLVLQVLFMAFAGVVVIYAISQWENIQARDFILLPYMRKHGAVLVGLFLIVWAATHQLQVWNLVFSRRGVVFGASYTDINATLPTLRLQMILLGSAGLAALANYWRPMLRLPALLFGLWVAVGLLGHSVYAGLLQRYVVEPNELDREAPYIAYNIAATRAAYGLENVEQRRFERLAEISAEELARNTFVLRNVRLWDERPLERTYEQLQELRPYYRFSRIDVDRYQLGDGSYRQVQLAARELEKANLPALTWVNERLIFTHGYGVVMNPVDEVTPEGQPQLWVRDLPPQVNIPDGGLTITRPEIYYGEFMRDYVLVNSNQPEFDYPRGDENVFSHYQGQGGVVLGGFWRRLLFAARMADPNILLSQSITPQTRIIFYRQIRERVAHIAPFLVYDQDPYLVIDRETGRLVWIIDAYTTSNRYPYATRRGSLNYIRNAAKVTVDAYDGTVTFYVTDPNDPLVQTYAAIFPDLFKPLEAMPPSLQDHLRYPRDLFKVQAQLFAVYHMQDVQVFYNKEDQWAIPNEIFEVDEIPMEPYYVILDLPGDGEIRPEFVLIQPYTPANKLNMIAWLAARNDPPNYGQLVVYEFPKQELIFGPMQVEARIDQDPLISQQLTLWSQRGSRVIRGNLLVIPLEQSVLYIEPLYLLAETGELPELKRVIVASGNRVVMRETLEEAIAALVNGITPATPGDVAEASSPADLPTPSPSTGSEAIAELVRRANEHYQRAEEARVEGDWARFGEELQALKDVLTQLEALTREGSSP
ncbi:MAG: UPF0182 family protein [Ardenticatenia bacterium]|nr:UPF0182 family protein [Ardenticatenia bacterium]